MYSGVPRGSEYINRLLEFTKREYGLIPTNIAPAKRGYFGETWRLNTATGQYFLKLDYSAKHKEIYRRSFTAIDRICSQGIDFISKIVRTSDGKLNSRFDSAVIGVFEWIDGENIQDERTKTAEYDMLAKIYTVPADGLNIPRVIFSTASVDLFYNQWNRLKNSYGDKTAVKICALFEQNRGKLEHRANRLTLFVGKCAGDDTNYYITHGDAGGNIIINGNRFYLVDWDDPIIAPPERDAWFGFFYWDWAAGAFNEALRRNGIAYIIRPERSAYYCYHSFFWYLTEYLDTYFEIGNRGGDMCEELKKYFTCWIEEEIRCADNMNL
ncbi:MAG: aminoglycoside phosphotransferase family protein [Oscillospiraceae bacterium]|nr:aminoglycoside phosphotransferase family protein [Oscillospiraceae bacterium]